MSMIDLADISGLPVSLDIDSCKLCPNDDVHIKNEESIHLNDISPILLNQFVKYPEYVGTIYLGVGKKAHTDEKENSRTSYDLIVIPFGLLGIEFNKSHIFYSEPAKDKISTLIEIVRGDVTVIVQRNEENRDPFAMNTVVESIEIIKLSKGQKFAIPTGVLFSFVNTGSSEAVISKISTENTKKIDYNKLKREKGLAFFIISKNAKVEVVANPKYKVNGAPEKKDFNEMNEEERSKYCVDFISQEETLYECLTAKKAELEAAIA